MPFWKKSEDPWDIDPAKRRAPVEKEPGLMDTLRGEWDTLQAERREKQAALRLTPEKCPWCGKEMEQGFLMGGKGVWWCRGIPSGKALWFGSGSENTMRVDTEGFLNTYHTAWYCPACLKMTINAAGLLTKAEENDPFFRREEESEQTITEEEET